MAEPLLDIAALMVAAIAAGAMNAVAGGGTFFLFPALLLTGSPAIAANVTCTIILWPAALSSAIAYRSHILHPPRQLIPVVALAIVGGAAGALLLLETPGDTFAFFVPWLLLGASVMFTYGPRLASHAARLATNHPHYHTGRMALALILLLLTAFYGGFFGAGIGILTLAILYLLEMDDIHHMNALKTIVTTGINTAAFIIFAFSQDVLWQDFGYLLPAAVLGGYTGARLSLRSQRETIRRVVLIVAWLATGYFFYDYYG